MADERVYMDAAMDAIRQAWSSNADYLEDLKERAAGGAAAPLVPFVGAGLSTGAM